jgi:hypothetical protein
MAAAPMPEATAKGKGIPANFNAATVAEILVVSSNQFCVLKETKFVLMFRP